jgi:hypothetical protein
MPFAALAQIIGDLATAAAAVIAICAAAFALWQVRLSHRLAAHDAYSDLLKTMLEYPEFARPNYLQICTDEIAYQKYKRYVGYLFTVCERMLIAEPRTSYWLTTVRYFLKCHIEHLRSEDFRENHLYHFCPRMRNIMIEIAS